MTPAHAQVVTATFADLRRDGPEIEVVVRALQPVAGRPGAKERPTEALTVPALIDTGAARTVLLARHCDKLNLKKRGSRPVAGLHGQKHQRAVYDIQMEIGAGITLDIEEIVESPLIGGNETQCLIGRDVLDRLVLFYDGPANTIICWQRPTLLPDPSDRREPNA